MRPLLMATTNSLAMELPYRDARYAILCLVVLALLVARCCGRRAPAVVPHDGTPSLLLAFYGAAFVLWTRDSGYLRFALTLELLGPLLAVALLLRWPRRMALALAVLALGATVALVKAPRRGGKPWTSDYFGVTAPEVPPGEVLGVLIGDEASAYYVPFFPLRVRFVRLESNYQAPFGDTAMKRDIRALIERHDGPMFLLSYAHRRAQDVGVLASYRLQLGPGEPVPVPSAVDCGAVWRPLSRRPAAAGAEGAPR